MTSKFLSGVFAAVVLAAISVSSSAFAADKEGCKDVPGIKRFEGSSIVLCGNRNFAEYTLPTGAWTKNEDDPSKSDFASKENLEGRLTRNAYSVPVGPSSLEVFRNYLNDLQSAGYKILWQAKPEETGGLEDVFGSKGPGGQLFGYSPDEARYVAAVKEENGVKTYVALYVIEYESGYVSGFEAAKGQVFVRLDSLQVGELKNQMVLASAPKADKEGCKDLPDIKRFEGSSIALCEKRSFAEYTLPTGKWVKNEDDSSKSDFASKEKLEGRLTENVYSVPAGASSAEVFRNYLNDLQSAGYKVLWQAKQQDTNQLEDVFGSKGPGGQLFGYSPDEARYAAAVKEENGVKTYLALYVIEFEDGYVPEFDAVKGQAYVRLDSLQAGELKNQMVLVSASEINKALDTSGKVLLYGIHFDFNKAVIKPESRPSLDEIGKFLKEQPNEKLSVVGYTDNIGGPDFNLQLSKARADAVVADLVGTYGVSQDRLKASGEGLQSPVAPNDNEDGRAKNRRVELHRQ